jgi:hypothetical protein
MVFRKMHPLKSGVASIGENEVDTPLLTEMMHRVADLNLSATFNANGILGCLYVTEKTLLAA